jgi:hypothetical protein
MSSTLYSCLDIISVTSIVIFSTQLNFNGYKTTTVI